MNWGADAARQADETWSGVIPGCRGVGHLLRHSMRNKRTGPAPGPRRGIDRANQDLRSCIRRCPPGLQCKLHIPGTEPTSDLPVRTDEDGYARFYAVRAQAGDGVRQLFLDCTDDAGRISSRPVDLTSDDTFTPRPVNVANERGTDRPALAGDPLSYSQAELIRAGYGLRPDPTKDPEAYARWLTSATKPGRLLEAKRPGTGSHHTVTQRTGPPWVGSVLRGSPNYISTEAIFNVPTAIPHASPTQIGVWNGLGGTDPSPSNGGLIQGGVIVTTTPTTAIYQSFREYCCGGFDPFGAAGGTNFGPGPGDPIYSEEWYCDSNGNLDINGGYGCTYLFDLKTGAVLSCTSSTGSPCPSVQALPLCSVSPSPNCWTVGTTAEFIIENESPQLTAPSDVFTDFAPAVTVTGSAYSSATGSYSQTISTDPTIELWTDYPRTDTTTHIDVSLASPNRTIFSTCFQNKNACGGCSPLTGGAPNGFCQVGVGPLAKCGVLRCDGFNSLACDTTSGAGNACGGCNTLAKAPFGACQEGNNCGMLRCAGPNAVTCDTTLGRRNACGGCGEMGLGIGGTGSGYGDHCICNTPARQEGILVCSPDKNRLICCDCGGAPGCGL
jgi:hypothetical protein